MKIAISGLGSQGKTTLLNALSSTEEFKNFKTAPSPTRIIQSEGFSINEKGTNETQMLIMMQHLKNVLLFTENTIFDRCALDGIAYSLYVTRNTTSKSFESLLYSLFEETIKQYDYIFYIEPELALVEDGTRSTDLDFFNGVKECFEQSIAKFNLPVIRIKGTVEERVELMLKTIKIKRYKIC